MQKLNFNLNKKKLLLLGFLFAVLLVIPLTVYLVQQQQETRSNATPNTTLTFTPSSATSAVGDEVSFDITANPGSNQVSAIKLVIKFDSTKLSATDSSFIVDPASNLTIIQGPLVEPDKYTVALSVGTNFTNVIRTETKIGTITFKVVGPSELPTEVSFETGEGGTEISSTNSNQDGNDENVFLVSGSSPASVTIQGGGTTETDNGNANASPTPQSGGETSGANQAPVCTALGMDTSASGVAPYPITFNASGQDTDGTISKVAFNFGDETIEEVTEGGGIGTDSVDVSLSHTYTTPGDYTASAVITDDQGATSDSVNCTATISITGNSTTSTGGNTTTTTDSITATPSAGETTTEVSTTPMPATGPAQTIVGAGVLGGILLMIGTLLFFAL